MGNNGARIERSRHAGQLREGYTTGACAAAAARAAVELLVAGHRSDSVTIELPCGEMASFVLHHCELTRQGDKNYACCSVIKDAGDDPDCTHGAEIMATVTLRSAGGVLIKGGDGVARVTKPGLELAVGEPAINPVPRRNIREMVMQVLQAAGKAGAEVVISVPDGEQRARQTINARLGLLGGISILGTRGTVKPYSTSAFAVSIRQQVAIVSANGIDELVLTTGSRSERFAMTHLPTLPDTAFVQAGDFVGVGLRAALKYGMKRVFVVAMIGKLAKLAAGHMMTHVSGHDINFTLLAKWAAAHGASENQVASVLDANTGRHVLNLLKGHISADYWSSLCRYAAEHAYCFVRQSIPVTVYMVDFDGALLGSASISASIDGKQIMGNTTEY